MLDELDEELDPSLSLELEDVPLELDPELDFLRGFLGAAGFFGPPGAAFFLAGFFFPSASLLPLLLELLDEDFLPPPASFFLGLSLSEPDPLPLSSSLDELDCFFLSSSGALPGAFCCFVPAL